MWYVDETFTSKHAFLCGLPHFMCHWLLSTALFTVTLTAWIGFVPTVSDNVVSTSSCVKYFDIFLPSPPRHSLDLHICGPWYLASMTVFEQRFYVAALKQLKKIVWKHSLKLKTFVTCKINFWKSCWNLQLKAKSEENCYCANLQHVMELVHN
jgi:hypothetical protein